MDSPSAALLDQEPLGKELHSATVADISAELSVELIIENSAEVSVGSVDAPAAGDSDQQLDLPTSLELVLFSGPGTSPTLHK